MTWPMDVAYHPLEVCTGDIGIFDYSEDRGKGVFKKLCSLPIGRGLSFHGFVVVDRHWTVHIPSSEDATSLDTIR